MVAVLSSQISESFFEKTNIKTLGLLPYDKLDTPVSSHSDMLLCVIENTVFTYNDYYYNNVELFQKITYVLLSYLLLNNLKE